MDERFALPLVLPNDCTWNERTKKYHQTGAKRKSLNVIPGALEELKKIKGPVCVVSVAGPQRKGKSFILSKAFDQGEVFPLGHSMTPETMGMWLWVVPQKFTDSNGQDFTVVLLDSEGSDSPNAKQEDDYGIFTLSVLLSSILIYNSTGVANRSDLENLDFITKLSQRIQLQARESPKDVKGKKHFSETFPNFIWLLRDVVLSLPSGCATMKDYFLKYVLNKEAEAGSSKLALQAAESILDFFSDFDAFSLPSPAFDPKVVQDLNNKSLKAEINPKFLEGIEQFKAILRPKLTPKKSINEGEYVTGEALATMVDQYVKAINTPGVVPNVECAWDTFVRKKCTDVLAEAVQSYKQKMTSRVKMPCDADTIRKAHKESLDAGLTTFRRKTFALSTKHVEKYLTEFRNNTETILEEWIEKNKCDTEVHCSKLLQRLKREILKPVLDRLHGPEAAQMEYKDLVQAYEKMRHEYNLQARGAKDVQARVLVELISELDKEKQQFINVLQRMKDYDENIEREKADRILAEEQQRRYEEIIARMNEEKINIEKQMKVMQEKQQEDIRRMHQFYEQKAKEQEKQVENMMKAHFDGQKREREQLIQQKKDLEQAINEIKITSDAINRENKKKGQEIEKSSRPGFMDIVAPIVTFGLGLASKLLPSPCSVM